MEDRMLMESFRVLKEIAVLLKCKPFDVVDTLRRSIKRLEEAEADRTRLEGLIERECPNATDDNGS